MPLISKNFKSPKNLQELPVTKDQCPFKLDGQTLWTMNNFPNGKEAPCTHLQFQPKNPPGAAPLATEKHLIIWELLLIPWYPDRHLAIAAIGPSINGDSCRDCHIVGWFSVAQLLRRGLEGNNTIDESDEINSKMWERTFGWIFFRSLLHSLRCLLQVAFDSGQYACHHHSSNGQFGSVQFLKLRQKTSFQWYLWVRGRNKEQLNFWIDSEAIAVHSVAPSWTRKTLYVTLGRSKQFGKQFDGKRLENWISPWYVVLPMQSAVGFFFSRSEHDAFVCNGIHSSIYV